MPGTPRVARTRTQFNTRLIATPQRFWANPPPPKRLIGPRRSSMGCHREAGCPPPFDVFVAAQADRDRMPVGENLEEGQAALRKHHVTLAMFSAVVRAIAHHAEGKTAATSKSPTRPSPCGAAAIHGSARYAPSHDPPTDPRRRVGDGSHARAGQGGERYNRPSIWHLLSRARFAPFPVLLR